jgi:hypothetical protein
MQQPGDIEPDPEILAVAAGLVEQVPRDKPAAAIPDAPEPDNVGQPPDAGHLKEVQPDPRQDAALARDPDEGGRQGMGCQDQRGGGADSGHRV